MPGPKSAKAPDEGGGNAAWRRAQALLAQVRSEGKVNYG